MFFAQLYIFNHNHNAHTSISHLKYDIKTTIVVFMSSLNLMMVGGLVSLYNEVMLFLSQLLFRREILSLRNGQVVGTARAPIINPNNLKIEGWYVVDRFSGEELVLPESQVREFSQLGLAVNDHTAMTPAEDLVRMQKTLKINFQLLKKNVVTESKQVLGKVSDFSFDKDSMMIQKLYVTPRGIKGFAASDKVIGRSQILNITDRQITVRDTLDKVGAGIPARASI